MSAAFLIAVTKYSTKARLTKEVFIRLELPGGGGGHSIRVERSKRGEHEMASHILWSQEEERVMALLPVFSPFIPPETPARRATLPTARVDFPASAHSTDLAVPWLVLTFTVFSSVCR